MARRVDEPSLLAVAPYTFIHIEIGTLAFSTYLFINRRNKIHSLLLGFNFTEMKTMSAFDGGTNRRACLCDCVAECQKYTPASLVRIDSRVFGMKCNRDW